MADVYDGFYKKLRSKIRDWLNNGGASSRWSEYIMLAPDLFHLLIKLTADPRTPIKEKAKLAALLFYFISPIDLIPEVIFGPVGFLDDLLISAWVLSGMINNTDPAIVRKYWAGDGDLLTVIHRLLALAECIPGRTLWNRLKRRF